MTTEIITWCAIALCISQSAIFSGLNLAFFSISRLHLDVEAKKGNKAAKIVLKLRNDSNFLLATILWGNVGINVLLTMLSDSVLTGLGAFLFSTIAITVIGEITPQAYFSRNALKMGSLLSPVIRFYQILFYPVAKPTALILDAWLGKEGITYLEESELRNIIRQHITAEEADLNQVEGIGALNFFALDEIHVIQEGEIIDPDSIIALPTKLDLPIIPELTQSSDDPFLRLINKTDYRWIILTNIEGDPLLALDADGFSRAAIYQKENFDPYRFCHRPVVITDESTPLNDAMLKMKLNASTDKNFDGDIEHDVLLIWGDEKRIITGADIFGLLLKGMSSVEK
ncbi:CNNM domain-containing protein [Marinomonas sp. RSW2]|uniref:CNNM domain-containing protein n=1 Tax=Marinomonas maritima TaxID=2940935 RepID=A0ABT5W9A3_9GAMM|nr:CNNM domain-containing protein [Marinomonas maritima]MDE8601399.1 CNNM domain-containing protein [Marinomonas maritima]